MDDLIPKCNFSVRLDSDGERWYLIHRRQSFIIDSGGKEIWGLIDGKRTIGDIVQILTQKFDATTDVIRIDVVKYLKSLESKQLIVFVRKGDAPYGI